MTVIGLDDTDSRTRGMCTTYVAASLADAVRDAGGAVERRLLVRLNPAVEHKTRGNAALALHTDLGPDRCLGLAREHLAMAEVEDPRTNPGVVVAPGKPDDPDAVPDRVAAFAVDAVRDHHGIEDAVALADEAGYETAHGGDGRGRIGALAAVGAWRAFDDWTYECISYRERERWGTDREVDRESVLAASDAAYPAVWDTVDRASGYPVCVPRTPCPVLHGIRGDDPDAVQEVADEIESEPVADRALFVTNQGTDAHLRDAGSPGNLREGRAYRVNGAVLEPPETREGGHVFVTLGDGGWSGGTSRERGGGTGRETIEVAAFEPTKRFRDRVRALTVGDELTVCGEVSDGTIKLEKFAVRDLVTTERVTPDCPDCGRSMSSAGANQGYRCRDCGTEADEKVERAVERDLDPGWYEVPPVARRHVAKPLVRGGFGAPTHPER